MFQTSRYQVPNKNLFGTDDKVRFYTGLPSMEVLMVVFEHVSSHVTRQTQNKNLCKVQLSETYQDTIGYDIRT